MNPEELDFVLEPDEHVYTARGAVVRGCTSLLTDLARRPIDPRVAASRRFKAAWDRATVRGKSVHRAVELWCHDDLDRRTVPAGIRPYFQKFLACVEKYEVEVLVVPETAVANLPFLNGKRLVVETPLVHPLGFGVTPDIGLAAVMGRTALVEVKAVSVLNAATALQTAAQEAAVNYFLRPWGLKVEERWCFNLNPACPPCDGCVKRYSDPADFPTFLAFLQVDRWRRNNW